MQRAQSQSNAIINAANTSSHLWLRLMVTWNPSKCRMSYVLTSMQHAALNADHTGSTTAIAPESERYALLYRLAGVVFDAYLEAVRASRHPRSAVCHLVDESVIR
jgi:hypothetical protein